MSAAARITVGSLPDVLLVPASCIFYEDGKTVVFRLGRRGYTPCRWRSSGAAATRRPSRARSKPAIAIARTTSRRSGGGGEAMTRRRVIVFVAVLVVLGGGVAAALVAALAGVVDGRERAGRADRRA